MNRSHDCQISLVALRPWPFGPPLRGRAPGHQADLLAAARNDVSSRAPWHWPPLGASPVSFEPALH